MANRGRSLVTTVRPLNKPSPRGPRSSRRKRKTVKQFKLCPCILPAPLRFAFVFCTAFILSRVKRDIGYLFAEMSHPLLGQSCDRGEEIIGRSPLQERYADMQSGRGVIRATV
ncbi:hypothetical protein OUZ56_013073 [Daphnia magna]|uniref:Uncharacterized protein n=1 Tax=Daphnia magna TaxID=35525 RepID=A0ABQ9Z4T2_9CRUS|nr:hypothetical protein OUZ56_013073 [Daphnia magna]